MGGRQIHPDPLEYRKQWQRDNKDWINERNRVYYRKHLDKNLFKVARSRASKYGIPFEIELADVVISDRCPVFGTLFQTGTLYAASLDRIDPNKGYVKGNVQVICRKANMMKSNATKAELRRFAEWVIANE